LYRVLKPGGHASIFEPINEVGTAFSKNLRASGYFDALEPTYGQVMDQYGSSPASTLIGWDERDLVGWFVEAGF
jgi:hypothetical protein